MIELTIDTLAVDAGSPDEATLKEGAPPEVHVQVVGGQIMPFTQPGTDRPLKIPQIALNFPLTKKAAIAFAEVLKTEAEKLPEGPSGRLQVASNMSAVEAAAERLKQVSGH